MLPAQIFFAEHLLSATTQLELVLFDTTVMLIPDRRFCLAIILKIDRVYSVLLIEFRMTGKVHTSS